MRPNRSQTVDHESKAWGLRCKGWCQSRIAGELGLTQQGISKLLGRIEARELIRLSSSVERIKVVQSGQLDHVIEESIEAWHRSKVARKRALRRVSTGGDGDGQGGDGDEVRRPPKSLSATATRRFSTRQ